MTSATAFSYEPLIRSRYELATEPAKLELLESFVGEECWKLRRNFKLTFRLRTSDAQKDVSVGYFFEPRYSLPDDSLPKIKTKYEFDAMLPPSSARPVLAYLSLLPFASIQGVTSKKAEGVGATEIDDVLDLDFIVMDGTNYAELLNALDEITVGPLAEGVATTPRRDEPFERILFLERIRGLYTTHYSDEFFRLKLSEQQKLPKDTQHMVVRNKSILYATPRMVGSTGLQANLYKRKGKSVNGYWPPQLRRYGRSVYWSQNSGQELMRWRDSEDDDYKQATPVCDLKQHGFTVRRIAAVDATEKDELCIVVNLRNEYRILFFADVNNGSFATITCPLRAIDSVAVLDGVIYAMGNYTDSLFPDVMTCYEDGKWSDGFKRVRDILPTAFFPLNGRLYLFANGLDTIEVFDPKTKSWSLNKIPKDMNDICGFTFFNMSGPATMEMEM